MPTHGTSTVETLLDLDSLLSTEDLELRWGSRCRSPTSEFSLDDVRVPDAAKLPGARGLSGPLACLSEARFGIVFGAVGAARDCLEATLAYVGTRWQSNSARRHGTTLEYPVIRHANNLESVLTYEGTSEVHQLVIGEALTGGGGFP